MIQDYSTAPLNVMKEYLEKLNEVEVVACVMVAAIIAATLMVGHALWKGIAGRKQISSQTKKHSNTGQCGDAKALVLDPATNVPQRLRRELFLKHQRASLNVNVIFPNRKTRSNGTHKTDANGAVQARSRLARMIVAS